MELGGKDPQSARSRADDVLCSNSLKLQLHILRDGHRVGPRHQATIKQCPDRQHIYARYLQNKSLTNFDSVRINILLPQGLFEVNNDVDWLQAMSTVQQTEWMDDEAKVIVELATLRNS